MVISAITPNPVEIPTEDPQQNPSNEKIRLISNNILGNSLTTWDIRTLGALCLLPVVLADDSSDESQAIILTFSIAGGIFGLLLISFAFHRLCDHCEKKSYSNDALKELLSSEDP